jgi:hypothetical protein
VASDKRIERRRDAAEELRALPPAEVA